MNRAILGVGAAILVLAFILIAFPIALTGQEQFDLEQEAGLYLLPPAFAVLLVGAISEDPRVTTVGGAFGNPDEVARRGTPRASAPALTYHPHESVGCRYCSTIIAADLAQCPRCGRARACRNCGRTLAIVGSQVTCPPCGRIEPLCNCRRLPPSRPSAPTAGRRV